MKGTYFFKNHVVIAGSAAVAVATLIFAADAVISGREGFCTGVFLSLFLMWAIIGVLFFVYSREAIRGKEITDDFKRFKKDITAHKIKDIFHPEITEDVPSAELKKGDYYVVRAGEQIPADGEITEGTAFVDESAITGESSPVIREEGGNRRMVTGGTVLLSDRLTVRVIKAGESGFLKRMTALLEGGIFDDVVRFKNMTAMIIITAVISVIAISVSSTAPMYSPGKRAVLGLSIFLCLIPLSTSVFFKVVNIKGTGKLNAMNVISTGNHTLSKLGKMKVLFIKKDIVAVNDNIVINGIKEKCELLRRCGIKTVLMGSESTDKMTATVAETGMDEYVCETGLVEEVEAVKRRQENRTVCGMCANDQEDAPALAQADIAIVMNNGAEEAKEAANLVILDSSPHKLMEIALMGKKILKSKKIIINAATIFEALKLITVILIVKNDIVTGALSVLLITCLQIFVMSVATYKK